jgi:Domain of unknown function (DUF4349)
MPSIRSLLARSPRLTLLILLGMLPVLLLAGCSGGGGRQTGSTGTAAVDAGGSVSSAGGSYNSVGDNKAPATGAPARTPLQRRDIVRTATVALTVPDVDRAADAAVAASTAAGGRADTDDRSSSGQDGRQAHLVLRVPAAGLDPLRDKVIALGHEISRTEQGSDVTTQVADVNARITELQISVGRLQDFLQHSGSITELVALESQLTQRQSDLQSTIAQQQALADQVSLATLTVQLSRTPAGIAGHARQLPGFSGAVRASWHALLLTGRLAMAGLGYLTPFLLVILLAGYLGLRHRRSARARPEPVEPG